MIFLQSKIPAGTGVHVAQRKPPAHAAALPPPSAPKSQVELLPNASFAA
jgi:hypothetical protein